MVEQEIITLGWREWVQLPELNLPPIKVKIDTGARTSALHAYDINPYERDGKTYVDFFVHPRQGDNKTVVQCKAAVIDQRKVTDSGGHSEDRWVIESRLSIGTHAWPIELTLTSRDNMRFRMLLGRKALSERTLIDPAKSYLVGKRPPRLRPVTKTM